MLFATFFYSCNKQKDIQPQSEKYLSFASVEEYNATLTKVLAMTKEERLAWEKQQGFTSFATKSNEVYTQVAEKELSVDELKQEIEKQKEYIHLTAEPSGDYVLEHALETSPKRFLCNANRMFKIENTLYKVFENNIVMCNEKHYTTLLSINEDNYNEVIGGDFQLMFEDNTLKDDAYKVPLASIYIMGYDQRYILERRNDNGSNRTRIRVGVDFTITFIPYTNNQSWYTYPSLWAETKPYKRILGIWYETSRTISCDYNVIYDYKENNIWKRSSNKSYSNNGTNTNQIFIVLENFPKELNLDPILYFNEFHIAAIKSWGKTPDTGRAQIYENEELIN